MIINAWFSDMPESSVMISDLWIFFYLDHFSHTIYCCGSYRYFYIMTLIIGGRPSRILTMFLDKMLSQFAFYCCDKTPWAKQLGKERIFLPYGNSPSSGKVKELKAGTWRQKPKADTMEEHCLLAFSEWLGQPTFLYIPGLPAQGWHCP